MLNAIKYKIPGKVAGSPQWFKEHYQDLLAVVSAHGMPGLFLTLTADEMTLTRWLEVIAAEAVARKINKDFTWQDCPVECAHIFYDRLQRFLNNYVRTGRDGKPGIFGKVHIDMVRIEVSSECSCRFIVTRQLHHLQPVADCISKTCTMHPLDQGAPTVGTRARQLARSHHAVAG